MDLPSLASSGLNSYGGERGLPSHHRRRGGAAADRQDLDRVRPRNPYSVECPYKSDEVKHAITGIEPLVLRVVRQAIADIGSPVAELHPADSAGRDGVNVVIVCSALEVMPRVDQYTAVLASCSPEHLPRGSRIWHRSPGQVLQRCHQSVLGSEVGDVGEAGSRIVEIPDQVGCVD